MKTPLHEIRSKAITAANRLQRAHSHLQELLPAFAEWTAGEIYVCKKTATYRYRHGERSKSVAPWDAIARKVFPTAAAFAYAAMVLGENAPAVTVPESGTKSAQPAAMPPRRANVIALAQAA